MDIPVFVDESNTVMEVIEKLLQTKRGYVLVRNYSSETVGIISDRDIQRLILREAGQFSPNILAKDFMVKPVIFITENKTLEEAEELMRSQNINRLPIIKTEDSKEVIGIINYETVHSNIVTNFARSWIQRGQ